MMISEQEIFNASIFIVDDQEANVQLLDKMLRKSGYRCITSTMDPHTVCALHRNNHYDLILLDLQMPGMNGFEVMEGLKEIEKDGYLPLIVITAHSIHESLALASGAKDFISKPFDLLEVKMRIRNVLEVRLLYKKLKHANQVLEDYNEMLGQAVLKKTTELVSLKKA
jgi:CheY-like chemotaxis protein